MAYSGTSEGSEVLILQKNSLQEIELVSSYVLMYENSRNPHELRKRTIHDFVKDNISIYIDTDRADEVKSIADDIIATGVKTADAYHVACALLADSDYFLTTDDRLLKYRTDRIYLLDPTAFIREKEVADNDDNG